MPNSPDLGHAGGVAPELTPMLADRGLPRGDLAGWAAEENLDGWRVIVVVDPALSAGVSGRTRRGHAITDRVPEIHDSADGSRRLILDGELVSGAGTASDFYGLLPRLLGRRHPCPTAPP